MAKTFTIAILTGAACISMGYSGAALLRDGKDRGAVASRPVSTSGLSPDRVVALGRLEPEGGVIAISGPPGSLLDSLEVHEGQQVERGTTLAVLAGRAELLAERAHLEAQLREAEARFRAEREHENALRAESEIHRRQIQELGDLEIQAQRAQVRLLREALKVSTRNLQRLAGLEGSAAVSPQELDQARLKVRRDQEDLTAAEALLAKLEAEHRLGLAQADAKAREAESASASLQAAIPLESLRRGMGLVEARLDRLTIRAPAAGRVLKILARPGEAVGTRPILQLGNTETMFAVAEVYETDRCRVREGMAAEITSAALPPGHETLRGQVERIGWTVAKNDVLGLDPSADAYARVVEVSIRLSPEASRVVEHLTNLQVEVRLASQPLLARRRGPGQ